MAIASVIRRRIKRFPAKPASLRAACRPMVLALRKRLEPRRIDSFHRIYYDSKVWTRTFWMGQQILKCPLDLWNYAEIIWETRPELIVESGTHKGGSGLYLAHMLELAGGEGRVLTIDLHARDDIEYPQHPRIEYLLGRSSLDPGVVDHVRQAARLTRTMVVLDSDHRADHVLGELGAYAELVTPGCYLIVEDTNISGHPVARDYGPGPGEALHAWGPARHGFEVDRGREQFLLTWNSGGYLRRLG
ncbi:MAG: cephalosporin hydroxylase family protein [Chloroflexota bacterium]|nr:cephalosporin hydroxylase family protein [Chloroflexota bacterium]